MYYENTIVLYDSWTFKDCIWQQATDYKDKLLAPNDWKYICTPKCTEKKSMPTGCLIKIAEQAYNN